MRSLALVPLTLAFGLASARPALADPVPSLDLRGFRASTDPASGIYLEPAAAPATGDYNFGAWLSYVYRPVVLGGSGDDVVLVRHQLTSDFTANVGFGGRFALGIDMPVLLAQGGDDPTPAARAALGSEFGGIPNNALGDLGFDAKWTLVPPTGGTFGGFALALHDRFTVPSGDDASFLGEGHVTNELRALAEYRIVAVSIHGALGLKLRGEQGELACADRASNEECPTGFGHELPFGLGLAFRPQALGIDDKGRWTWYLETHGYLPLSPSSPFSNQSVSEAQIGLGARFALGDVSLLGGVETAMAGGVGNAAFRGLLSVGWAPRLHDADGDGVEDDRDQCRELAEDHDHFQDDDGCPEGDNDDDGVPDGDDRCPTEKEDEDGFQDDDGCPDPDNDGDKIPDDQDRCPDSAGPASDEPGKNGCPNRDADNDGIADDKDKCPDQPEDRDGTLDDDGCPDPDNDGDGIADTEDACPELAGPDASNPREKGCPEADKDHDTYVDAEDKCPDQPETWNGIEDGDGCPDDPTKGRPLVVVRTGKDGPVIELAAAVKFTDKDAIEPASMPLVRALSVELRNHAGWTVAVGVRPADKAGPNVGTSQALARAFAVVDVLRRTNRREGIAETVAWVAVKDQPSAAAHGIGFLVLVPEPKKDGDKKADAGAKDGATKSVATEPKKDGTKPAEPKKDGTKPAEPKKDAPKPAEPKKDGTKPAEPKKDGGAKKDAGPKPGEAPKKK